MKVSLDLLLEDDRAEKGEEKTHLDDSTQRPLVSKRQTDKVAGSLELTLS